jgi:methyl-accepting chemotaxis protein
VLEEAGEAPERAPDTGGEKPPRPPAGGVGATTRWITSPRRLPWLLVAVSLLPVIAIAIIAETQTRSLLVDAAGREVRNAAVSSIVDVESNVRRSALDAKAISMSDRVRAMAPAAAIDRLTDATVALDPLYRQMILVDTKGRVVAMSVAPPGTTQKIEPSRFLGKSIGRPSWFTLALKGAQDGRANAVIQTVEPRPVIGRLEGTGTAPVAPVTSIGVVRGRKPVGVLAIFTNWSAFTSTAEESTGAYASRAAQGGLGIYLADRRGRILLTPTGGTDLGANVSSDPVYQEAQNSKVPGYMVVGKGGTLIPADSVAGYAPMDQQLGDPPLDWVTFAVEEKGAALQDARRLTRFLVITTVLVGIIAVLVALAVSRSLTRRARQLRLSSVEVEAGSERLQESAETSRARAQLTEERAEEQIASIEEIRALVAEMQETGAEIARSAQLVSEQAGRAASAGEEGKAAAAAVDRAMGDIDQRVRGISSEISALAGQTAQISEIIATVSSIADQSNLLAFNATIEAAKAGEHGAGFSVVAEEVRMLAEQSKRATAQIRSILGEIDKAARDAERSAEQGIEAVGEGRRRAESAAATIEELAAANEEAERTTREIANAAPEQQAAAERFVAATDVVGDRSRAVQSAAHESARSAAELDTLAEQLRDLAKTLTKV